MSEKDKQKKTRRVTMKELLEEIDKQFIPEGEREATKEDYLNLAKKLEASYNTEGLSEALAKAIQLNEELRESMRVFGDSGGNIRETTKGLMSSFEKAMKPFHEQQEKLNEQMKAAFENANKRIELLRERFEFYNLDFKLYDIETDIELLQRTLDANIHSEPPVLFKYFIETFYYKHFKDYITKYADFENALPQVEIPEDAPQRKKLIRLYALFKRLFKEANKEPQAKMTMNVANALMRNEKKKREDVEKASKQQKEIRRQFEEVLSEVMLSEELDAKKKEIIYALAVILSEKNYDGERETVKFTEPALGGQKVETIILHTSYKEVYKYAGVKPNSKGQYTGEAAIRLKKHLDELEGKRFAIPIQQGKHRRIYRQPLFNIMSDSITERGKTTLTIQVFPSMYEGADNNFIQFSKNKMQQLRELASGKNIDKLNELTFFLQSYDNSFIKISKEKLAEITGLKSYIEQGRKSLLEKRLKELLELCKKGKYIFSYKKVNDCYEIRINPQKKRVNPKKSKPEKKKKKGKK